MIYSKMNIFLKERPESQLIGKDIYIYITEFFQYMGMPSQCRPTVEHFYNTPFQSVGYFF